MADAQQLIRVIIADDHNMVRKGLRVLLEEFDDLEVIAECTDGQYAVDTCRKDCPDVVLMDMIMPRLNGIEATVEIKAACPNTQIIALTSFSDEDHVKNALEAGAVGYLDRKSVV